ncbi:hypothetical protein AAFC00_006403 [Neodothiora populina]|uniref:Alkyl hydroperoxide reductase subunit C/ Thiol specific antioxidant domain-containing protein n=1 Tax=Neodothiora populina TaxID=2781224 RepID=A0ABR3P526_9PEZI
MLSRLVSRLPILLLLQSWTDDLKKSHWKPTLVPITGLLSSFSQEPGRSPAQQRSKHSVLASKEFLYSRSCAVVFVSTDSHSQFTLKAWNNSGELEGGLGGVYIPLVSDSSHSISRDYGVLIEEQGAAERALFIIDPKGVIRNITVSDADVGRSVDETQRVIDALAFKDEYGEGCPVNWKKGDQGLEYSAQTRVEGPIEVSTIHKKSWSDWVSGPFFTACFLSCS